MPRLIETPPLLQDGFSGLARLQCLLLPLVCHLLDSSQLQFQNLAVSVEGLLLHTRCLQLLVCTQQRLLKLFHSGSGIGQLCCKLLLCLLFLDYCCHGNRKPPPQIRFHLILFPGQYRRTLLTGLPAQEQFLVQCLDLLPMTFSLPRCLPRCLPPHHLHLPSGLLC